MKKNTTLLLIAAFLAISLAFLVGDAAGIRTNAQKAETPQTTEPKMPDVIILGKDAKLGQITFNHVKHNGGTYTIGDGKPIACISCHHTAQPAADAAKFPPLKTAWPADRTTTLTADLFAKDPKGAGVAACRDCHARTGDKPKLIDAIPEVKHEGSTSIITLNNQQAFHRTCAGCHVEVKKNVPMTTAPQQTQCMSCHKKSA